MEGTVSIFLFRSFFITSKVLSHLWNETYGVEIKPTRYHRGKHLLEFRIFDDLQLFGLWAGAKFDGKDKNNSSAFDWDWENVSIHIYFPICWAIFCSLTNAFHIISNSFPATRNYSCDLPTHCFNIWIFLAERCISFQRDSMQMCRTPIERYDPG